MAVLLLVCWMKPKREFPVFLIKKCEAVARNANLKGKYDCNPESKYKSITEEDNQEKQKKKSDSVVRESEKKRST